MSKLLEAIQEDKNFIKKLAMLYIELGDFKFVELHLQIPIGEIEKLFEELPDLSNEFDDALNTLTVRKLRREGSHKIFKVIKSLYDVLENADSVEDGGPTTSDKVKAANALAKLLEPPKSKKGDKGGDDLDDLLRQLENGS